MSNSNYTIKNILLSTFNIKNNLLDKKLIYNKAPLGKLDSKWIKLMFFILPFLMYGAIFNPKSFAYLGIAQAIVSYIVLLVFAMQIIMAVAFFNNRGVVKMVESSWKSYFPDIDFKMILSSGMTPYVDFKKYYQQALNDGLDGEALHSRLLEDFKKMEKENHILYNAMNRDKK
jgi:hypothetical protein